MKENYDIRKYYDALGYPPTDSDYFCKDLRVLSVFCRGNRKQIESILESTPFKVDDDRFRVSVADYSNCSLGAYFDASVAFAVAYGEARGMHYCFEYEDQWWSVAGGRERAGYPKRYGEIHLDPRNEHMRGSVTLKGSPVFDVEVSLESNASGAAWDDMKLVPHLLVRAVPEIAGSSFRNFDILSRDTSPDFVLKSREFGKARVNWGAAMPSLNGEPLEIVEILGAEYVTGDYAYKRPPIVIDSLV